MTEYPHRDRFEYLVIADCGHCGEEVRYTEEFEQPVPIDQSVEIKWETCPRCSVSTEFYDVKAEYEIERVQPAQELRQRDPEDNPFQCSICGAPLGSIKRIEGEEHCDGCQKEYGPA